MAGIDHSGPGFSHLRCRPLMDARCGTGHAHHDTAHGRVATAWGSAHGQGWFELVLPPGVTANVALPGQPGLTVHEGRHRFKLETEKPQGHKDVGDQQVE